MQSCNQVPTCTFSPGTSRAGSRPRAGESRAALFRLGRAALACQARPSTQPILLSCAITNSSGRVTS